MCRIKRGLWRPANIVVWQTEIVSCALQTVALRNETVSRVINVCLINWYGYIQSALECNHRRIKADARLRSVFLKNVSVLWHMQPVRKRRPTNPARLLFWILQYPGRGNCYRQGYPIYFCVTKDFIQHVGSIIGNAHSNNAARTYASNKTLSVSILYTGGVGLDWYAIIDRIAPRPSWNAL